MCQHFRIPQAPNSSSQATPGFPYPTRIVTLRQAVPAGDGHDRLLAPHGVVGRTEIAIDAWHHLVYAATVGIAYELLDQRL